MLKGKRLDEMDLIDVADGKTKVIVVSQSGYEKMCVIDQGSLEDAIYDVRNNFCEIYISP